MFNELENILNILKSDLKHLSDKIERIERKIDQTNGRILSITETVEDDMVFYSRKEVAEKLNVHIDTVTNYINNGELESVRIGRRILIEKKGFVSFVDRNRQKCRVDQM